MMDREITCDDLLNQIEAEGNLQGKLATQVARLGADMAMEMTKNLDMVSVVRCKNCMHGSWRSGDHLLCMLNDYYVQEDGFCSDGYPKEEGQ